MSDVNKFIDRAEKLLDKGKGEQALAEYRSALELQPANEQLLEKAADLGLTIGQLGIASDLLRRLFSRCIETRQLGSAGLTFRKLQRLKALDPEMVCSYAELLGNTNRKEAAEAYRVAFQEFQRLGDPRRSLDCVTKALEHEQRIEDYREQARIAEALHERKLAAEALVHLGVLLEQLSQDPSDAYARAYADDPQNLAARLGHGRALIAHKRAAEAVELLQPLATYPSSPEEAREPYCLALLAVGRVEEAEPFVWGLFERDPGSNLPVIHSVIRGLVDRNSTERALVLARRLEEYYRKAGRRHEFMQDIAQIAEACRPDIQFTEYLAELYNGANREIEYAQVLSRLFDLYFDDGQFARALDALDRAVDIDPYEAEHKERMTKLAGHVPDERLHLVARRLGIDAPEQIAVEAPQDEAPTPQKFEDLFVQAEIFLQYGMRDKALQKISQLKRSYPTEMESDPRVRPLLISAGLPAPAPAPVAAAALPEEPRDRASESMVRAAEVSRLIARQSDPRTVLVTAVNQIGTRWQYSRCLAALATPGKPPSLVVEYCSPDVPKSERSAMVRLLALSQRLTASDPVFRAADVQLSEPLTPIRQELARLNVYSLVVVSLISEDKPIGLMIVQQCSARRRWSNDDLALLRSMADQVALAVHGARLKSLVSTLGFADEKTGLLKRSSYIDAVVNELGRQQTGGGPTGTLALIQAISLTSDSPENVIAELVRALRAIAQDQGMFFRYDRETVAALLPKIGAPETQSMVALLREALEPIAITITAGIAPCGSNAGFDPEDAATEWINRADRALAAALDSPDRTCALPPVPASTA